LINEECHMAADDFVDALRNVRRNFGRRLRVNCMMTEIGATNAIFAAGASSENSLKALLAEPALPAVPTICPTSGNGTKL
jgi:hypothetical protein